MPSAYTQRWLSWVVFQVQTLHIGTRTGMTPRDRGPHFPFSNRLVRGVRPQQLCSHFHLLSSTTTMATQVIDLTDDTSDIEEINAAAFTRTNTEGKVASRRERKRKRSGQDAGDQDNEVKEGTPAEIEGSPARKSRRRKNKSARSSPAPTSAMPNMDDLFFVDTAPAPIPQDLAFYDSKPATAPASSSSNSTEDSASVKTPETPALLLPAHVSVLAENANGKPIEIIRPPSPGSDDTDVESFIQYLDYDDRPVRLNHHGEYSISHEL